MRTLIALCFCVLLTGAVASAQQSASHTQTFRTDVEAVEIDVRAIDGDGRPVRGLTANDFELYEDDVRQQVRAFTPVQVPRAPRLQAARAEPDVRSNREAFDGRIYVFVLDDLHTHPLRTTRAKAAVRLFLERYLNANDRAAIVTTGGTTDAVQELTGSRTALLRAVDAFHGRKMRSSTLDRLGEYYRLRDAGELEDRQRIADPYEQQRVHHARMAMVRLREVARWLDTVPARRKALIFVSEGIDYDITDLIENRFASGVLAEVRDAIAGAQRSNTAIYTVDPRALGGIEEETIEVSGLPDDTTDVGPSAFMAALRMTQDSLRILAEQTGGFAVVNTNNLAGGFDRLLEEQSAYYVLTYQPTNTRRDGRFRRVEVRTTRPGVRVVARSGYFAARADERPSAPAAGSPMRALLDSPLPVTGLPLQTSVAAFRGEKGDKDRASVLVTAEIGPAFTLTEKNGLFTGRLEVSTAAVDMNGRIAASDHRHVDLNLRPATRDAVLQHGVRTTGRLALKAGRYQVRIAVRDAFGTRAGTVLHDLDVPAFHRMPVGMSHLVLASQSAIRTATANVDESLKTTLTLPPTVAREFPRDDVLTVMAELYDNRKDGVAPLAVTTSVTDAGDRVVFRSEERVEAFAFEPMRRAYRHSVQVPLRDLAPGDYVLRVHAGSLIRDVPFTVRADRTNAD